jgi:YidC/Oxa1 family membrane protein insertase
MGYIYNTFIYEPLYNGFTLLSDLLPFFDVGIIIVLFTIIIKIILFPLSKKAVRTQAIMKMVEPELTKIKEKYASDKQKQALEIMNLYKSKNINPFSSILLIIIQIPILFAIYKVFYTGFYPVNTEILYSFVRIPEAVQTVFLGLVDVGEKSWVLAIIAAVSQYFQIKFSVPNIAPKKENPSFSDDFARNMNLQMRYVFPVIILFVSYTLPAALAIYWTTSNLFMIGQEIVVRKSLAKEGLKK